MLLDLPNVIQSTSTSCGDAAVACLLKYLNINASVHMSSTIDGVGPRTIEGKLRTLGLVVVSGSMTVDDIRHYCNHGRPVILLVRWDEDEPENSHYIVSRGVSRGRVYYHDVADGRDSITIPEFERQWHAIGELGEKYIHWGIVGYFSKGTLANT